MGGVVSSIFGGGSSKSSSSSSTSNNVTVNPTTNVDIDFDLDSLANAIKQGNEEQIKIELIKAKLEQEKAKLEQENTNAIIKAQNDENAIYKTFTENIKGLGTVALIGGGYYLFIHKKRKGKN